MIINEQPEECRRKWHLYVMICIKQVSFINCLINIPSKCCTSTIWQNVCDYLPSNLIRLMVNNCYTQHNHRWTDRTITIKTQRCYFPDMVRRCTVSSISCFTLFPLFKQPEVFLKSFSETFVLNPVCQSPSFNWTTATKKQHSGYKESSKNLKCCNSLILNSSEVILLNTHHLCHGNVKICYNKLIIINE